MLSHLLAVIEYKWLTANVRAHANTHFGTSVGSSSQIFETRLPEFIVDTSRRRTAKKKPPRALDWGYWVEGFGES